MFQHTLKALACALPLFAGFASAADPISIKFAHVVAEHTPKGQGAFFVIQHAGIGQAPALEDFQQAIGRDVVQAGQLRVGAAAA